MTSKVDVGGTAVNIKFYLGRIANVQHYVKIASDMKVYQAEKPNSTNFHSVTFPESTERT